MAHNDNQIRQKYFSNHSKLKITMKKIILFAMLFGMSSVNWGQDKITCLTASGPDLLETKKEVKYGTPLCVEVLGVNTFLMKTYSTYTPINFDFSTKGFLDFNFPEKQSTSEAEVNKKGKLSDINIVSEMILLENKIDNKKILINNLELKMATSGSNDIDKLQIKNLEEEIANLKIKSDKLDEEIKKLTKNNEKLKKQYDSIFNIVTQSQKFKDEFKIFQKHFLNIDKYTTLKNTLLKQINRDSIFISNTKNFQARSKSSYNAVYGLEDDHLKQKIKVTEELSNLETSYLNLVSIFEQLNISFKNKELKLSGELKDGKNVLKFDKITASFETKYLFGEEMKKVKVINDSLIQSKNRTKIIEEAQAGIDLYDEIMNSNFTKTIISDNVYDDSAKIKLQLKNNKGKVVYEYREFEVKSYGNWKVNGSAGYFLNFISDDNYTIRKKNETDPISKTGISKASSSALKHSLGGLLHAYYNFKGSVDAGFSVGLSINDNANVGFYMGGSVFLTETNRLVITSGISFNKINKISMSNLVFEETKQQYNFTNESDTEIRYDEVYKPALFIGISYNLF
ncbi:hypothetical protein AAGV28_08050 [Flavobacterium sp. FZUC8N2.13]|uniref:Uncharacterized protein n=1 Tax=Flavobacterium zubiriense TaxID=3138075 RepID=A0ABV4TB54_9FLAO